ncbi:MAG: PilZ domain-containing protein [Deltaproteobacteria bacterium]|nr:PilZ domain-containing protein [Deltaproteobacteria bacterium]
MEKRREYRIPLAIPATFSRANIPGSFKGYLENISPNGALANIATFLPKSTSLKLFFDVPETGERVETEGAVRWCKKNGTCRLGMEFQKKISVNLLYEAARFYPEPQSMIKTSVDYSDKRMDLLQQSIIDSQHLTYWGAMSMIFSESIKILFFQFAGQLELSILRFEKFYRHMEKFSVDPELKTRAGEAISALELVSGKFNKTAIVFGSLKEKYDADMAKSERHIDLTRIIEDKINFLQDITIKLTNRKCKINYLPKKDLPLVYGQYSDFAQSMDFLLLYSYQSILFGNCTEITVQSMLKNQTIRIDFFNDGSKILKEDDIVINSINCDFVDQLSKRDVKNILGLYYSLIPLEKYKASIVVHSESGNNIVSLCIPVIGDSS